LEKQAQIQREQLDMICTQQQFIDVLKQMLIKLLRRRSRRLKGLRVGQKASKLIAPPLKVLMMRMLTLRNHQLYLRRRRVQTFEVITRRG